MRLHLKPSRGLNVASTSEYRFPEMQCSKMNCGTLEKLESWTVLQPPCDFPDFVDY